MRPAGSLGKNARESDCLGYSDERLFDLGLIVGNFRLLRLNVFNQSEQFLLIVRGGRLCRDRSRCHHGDQREGKEKFHREKCCLTMR